MTYRFATDNFGSCNVGTPAADHPGVAAFFGRNTNWLLKEYDIVLCLGVFHKIENEHLDAVFGPIVERTRQHLLCRGGCTKPSNREPWLKQRGFALEGRLERMLRAFRRE